MEEIPNTSVTLSAGPTLEMWQTHQATIKKLYLHEHRTLRQVMQIMKRDYGLDATEKMYKRGLTLWRMDNKNLRKTDVKYIALRKVERDAVGKRSQFFIKGREIDMENVYNYLKKRGFSSLEEFTEAASPVTQEADIFCKTAVELPLAKYNDRIDIPVVYRQLDVAYPRFPSTEMPVIHDDAISIQHERDLVHFLSLSPAVRSRQVLSLSPVPRSLAPPAALLLHEKIVSTFNSYLSANLEEVSGPGGWNLTTHRVLLPKRIPSVSDRKSWMQDCQIAIELLRQQKYVQFRQTLSQTCAGIELDVKIEDPGLIRNLLSTTHFLNVRSMPQIASMVFRHAHRAAILFLGKFHPVAEMCKALLELGSIEFELIRTLWQFEADCLGRALGLQHYNTICTMQTVIAEADPGEAVLKSRAFLESYEVACSQRDIEWFKWKKILALSLFINGELQEAMRFACDFLGTLDAAPQTSYTQNTKSWLLILLTSILSSLGDLINAEYCARRSMHETMALYGWRDRATIPYMVTHVHLLRIMGCEGEAKVVEGLIQDILGPPEIIELLD